jgi:hypothetical protein
VSSWEVGAELGFLLERKFLFPIKRALSPAEESLNWLCASLKLLDEWFLIKSSVAFQFYSLVEYSVREW